MAKRGTGSDAKSFDVTTPANATPDTSSRPIVVGNRPMIANDPMMVAPKAESKDIPSAPAVRTGKIIGRSVAATPLPDSPTNQAETNEKTTEPVQPIQTTTPMVTPPVREAPPAPSEPGTVRETEPPQPAKPLTDIEQASQDEQKLAAEIARQTELEELIQNGTYAVPIGTSHDTSKRAWLLVVILIAVGLIMAVDLLLDAGTVQLNGLPHTNLIGMDTAKTTSQPVTTRGPTPVPSSPTLSSETITLATASITTIDTNLETFYAQNNFYPGELSASSLTAIDPTLLSPPVGVAYAYVPGPKVCTTAAKTCTSFTLTAMAQISKATIASKQSAVTK